MEPIFFLNFCIFSNLQIFLIQNFAYKLYARIIWTISNLHKINHTKKIGRNVFYFIVKKQVTIQMNLTYVVIFYIIKIWQ